MMNSLAAMFQPANSIDGNDPHSDGMRELILEAVSEAAGEATEAVIAIIRDENDLPVYAIGFEDAARVFISPDAATHGMTYTFDCYATTGGRTFDRNVFHMNRSSIAELTARLDGIGRESLDLFTAIMAGHFNVRSGRA